MMFYYILAGTIALGAFNIILSHCSDKKELEKLKHFLLIYSGRYASAHRFAGYGGGWVTFEEKCGAPEKSFSFLSDTGLYSADNFITKNSSSKIVFRESQ